MIALSDLDRKGRDMQHVWRRQQVRRLIGSVCLSVAMAITANAQLPITDTSTVIIQQDTLGCVVMDRKELKPFRRILRPRRKVRAFITCVDGFGNVVAMGLDAKGRVRCSGKGFYDPIREEISLVACGVIF
jgi:hypothetical protein